MKSRCNSPHRTEAKEVAPERRHEAGMVLTEAIEPIDIVICPFLG
jgi:hypothetical protein